MSFDDDIVEAYSSLLGIAERFCSHDDAHDLAAETVTRAIEHRECYDESRPLLPWCRAIMRNLWISTQTRLSTAMTTRLGEWESEGGTEADQLAIVGDIKREIEDLRRRSVCVDTLIEFARGYSIAEISVSDRLPEGTVKRRIHEARNMLRNALER